MFKVLGFSEIIYWIGILIRGNSMKIVIFNWVIIIDDNFN